MAGPFGPAIHVRLILVSNPKAPMFGAKRETRLVRKPARADERQLLAACDQTQHVPEHGHERAEQGNGSGDVATDGVAAEHALGLVQD